MIRERDKISFSEKSDRNLNLLQFYELGMKFVEIQEQKKIEKWKRSGIFKLKDSNLQIFIDIVCMNLKFCIKVNKLN